MKLINQDIIRRAYVFKFSNVSWNSMDTSILFSTYNNSIIHQIIDKIDISTNMYIPINIHLQSN